MESIRNIINLTFKRAAFMGWAEDNPASKIIWSDYRKMLYVPPSIKDRAYTTAELHEMDEFLHKHQAEKPWYIPAYAIEFQKITGARRGEIPPLLWEDVDFEKGTIFFHRELISQQNKQTESEYICDYTKNGTARFYPIADKELEFLKKLKKVHDKYYPDSPYLFPSAKSKHGCITNNMAY